MKLVHQYHRRLGAKIVVEQTSPWNSTARCSKRRGTADARYWRQYRNLGRKARYRQVQFTARFRKHTLAAQNRNLGRTAWYRKHAPMAQYRKSGRRTQNRRQLSLMTRKSNDFSRIHGNKVT